MSNNLNTTNQSVEHQNIEWKKECKNDNRLTLWNAGKLPDELTIEQLFKVHESIPRNPLLAEVCYKAGYIDSWGRGVEKITVACRDAKLPDPLFIERSGRIVVELNRSLPKSPEKSSEEMRKKFGRNAEEKRGDRLGNELGNSRTVIIKVMRANPKISATTLAEILNISTKAIEKNIKLLKEDGVVKRINGTRGHWEIIDE